MELPNREMMALVNVVLVDVIDVGDVTIQVPIGVAANICDVNAAVLVGQFQDDGSATCTATAESTASAGQSGAAPGQQGR